MEKLNIALGLIEQGDTYVLQLRNFKPEKGGVGKIGCFGGKIEPGETAQEACKRELSEETNIHPDLDDLERLGKVEVVSDHQLTDKEVKIDVFALNVDEGFVIEALEGELVVFRRSEASEYLTRMTPGTRRAFEEFIIGKE